MPDDTIFPKIAAVLGFIAAILCIILGFIVPHTSTMALAIISWLVGFILGIIGITSKMPFKLYGIVAVLITSGIVAYGVWCFIHNWNGHITPFM